MNKGTGSWSGTRTSFPPKERRQILKRDPVCRCHGCKHHTGRCTQPSTEADHKIPLAEGGPPGVENGQGLCSPCHREKTLTEIARGRTRKSRRRPTTEKHPGLRGGG